MVKVLVVHTTYQFVRDTWSGVIEGDMSKGESGDVQMEMHESVIGVIQR
jgi:hypothetical protein